MTISPSEMSITVHKDENLGSSNSSNVVLYHSDNPVISVEQGTTFGLIKMLYESIGGRGQIIGLRQRQSVSTLPCIITQDQTVLTEREYDIILHGKSNERSVIKNAPICHDKDVNTYITVKPDAQIWQAYSFPTAGQIAWGKDIGSVVKRIETRTKDDFSWSERRDSHSHRNDEGLVAHNIDMQGRDSIAVSNVLEYEISRKKLRVDDENEEIRVVSPRDSTSPSTTSTESPGQASRQDSPSQVEQSQKRKWQCFYCKKLFMCRSAYDNHERTHTGEKPFQCNVCGRSFGHQGNLKQHMHIHRDVKPHICEVCGRGFTRSNRLRDHKRSHQYELYMHTKVQWSTSKSLPREDRADVSPVSSSGFDESATSDQNQEK